MILVPDSLPRLDQELPAGSYTCTFLNPQVLELQPPIT